jgi:hypothetical protein
MSPTTLVNGRTYFRLTYADRDLTMPGVQPLVFLGEVTDENGTHGFVFQDTESFIQHGHGLEGDDQHADISLYFLADSDLGAVWDLEEIAAEIAEAAGRAASLNHPTLKVLGKK